VSVWGFVFFGWDRKVVSTIFPTIRWFPPGFHPFPLQFNLMLFLRSGGTHLRASKGCRLFVRVSFPPSEREDLLAAQLFRSHEFNRPPSPPPPPPPARVPAEFSRVNTPPPFACCRPTLLSGGGPGIDILTNPLRQQLHHPTHSASTVLEYPPQSDFYPCCAVIFSPHLVVMFAARTLTKMPKRVPNPLQDRGKNGCPSFRPRLRSG